MNVILRPVNDRFLEDVAFPAFSLGVVDAAHGVRTFETSNIPRVLEMVNGCGLEAAHP